ncbi:hypothetical protein OAH90_05165 [Alphaproteobacteria bacterium]|nr:hypothetical protein [Alphaproteobacteria bacterium]
MIAGKAHSRFRNHYANTHLGGIGGFRLEPWIGLALDLVSLASRAKGIWTNRVKTGTTCRIIKMVP